MGDTQAFKQTSSHNCLIGKNWREIVCLNRAKGLGAPNLNLTEH